MNYLKLIPIALLSLGPIALADASQARVIDTIGTGRRPTPVFVNAGTLIPAETEFACVRDIVKYETRYNNQVFTGTMWIKQSEGIGCSDTTTAKRITAYFEERSADRRQWCSGEMRLVLQTVRDQGLRTAKDSVIQWTKIKAVPGFACDGAGQTPSLKLRYSPAFER